MKTCLEKQSQENIGVTQIGYLKEETYDLPIYTSFLLPDVKRTPSLNQVRGLFIEKTQVLNKENKKK